MDIFKDFDAVYTADYYGDTQSNEDAESSNDDANTKPALLNTQTALSTYVEEYRDIQGNAEEILKYPDPLKHIQKLKLDAFEIIKN